MISFENNDAAEICSFPVPVSRGTIICGDPFITPTLREGALNIGILPHRAR